MKRNNEKDDKKGVNKREQHYANDIPKTPEKIDPMGTEVMQEDRYQTEKHGELPKEDQNKNPKK